MSTGTGNFIKLPMRLPLTTLLGAFVSCLLLSVSTHGNGVVTNCTEANLRAALAGGGTVTFACDGMITLTSTISNLAETTIDATGREITISGGHGVRVFHVATNTTLKLINLTVADGSGGSGAGVLNHGQVSLQECVFSGNQAVGAAGPDGIWPATPPASGENGCGGAIFNAGVLEVMSCTFRANTASGGAGGAGIHGDIFPGADGRPGAGAGTGSGGAIFNAGTLLIQRSLFIGNLASGGVGGSGGIGGPGGSGATSGGAAAQGGDGLGAALFSSGGNAGLVNCTVTSNTCIGGCGGAGGWGGDSMTGAGGNGGNGGNGGSGLGAIWADSLCGLTNCTLAFNLAVPGTGGFGGGAGSGQVPGTAGAAGSPGSAGGGIKSANCGMVNTVLATNTPGGNCIGTINDMAHNLSSDGSCVFTNTGSLNHTDPLLSPVADNGGPTLTMALLTGSPAIDAGDAAAPATDQRGFPRPFGVASDIGAYEFGSMLPHLAINRSGATELELVVSGNSNQPCRLFTSSDLAKWQCVGTNQIGPDGTTLFRDDCGIGGAQMFYRVSMP